MKQTVVGKLYMIGCGHCDALIEPWDQMKKKIGGKVMVVEDIESNQTKELEKLNKQHGSSVSVQGGYPTIFKIQNGGKVEYYNGERTTEKLASWALQGSVHRKKKTVHRKNRTVGGKSRRRRQK
jgi:thiol-disulfide isomerase/thioredoxin